MCYSNNPVSGSGYYLLKDVLLEMSDKFSEKDFEKIVKELVRKIPGIDKTKMDVKFDYNYDRFGEIFFLVIISNGKNLPIKIRYIGDKSDIIINIVKYIEERVFISEIKREMERIPGFGKLKLEIEWCQVIGFEIGSSFSVLEAKIFDDSKSFFETLFFNDEKVKIIRIIVRAKVRAGQLDKEFVKEALIKRIIKSLERRKKFRKFEKWLKQIFRGFKINSGTTN